MSQKMGRGTTRSGQAHNRRAPNRGGIHKHNSTSRVDKDGDLVMGATPVTRAATSSGRDGRVASGSGSGRGSRKTHSGGETHYTTTPATRLQNFIRNQRGLPETLPRGPRGSFQSSRRRISDNSIPNRLDEISIIGLQQSKVADKADGGSSDLCSWLEFKANKNLSQLDAAKITKSRVEGAALIISVRPEDTSKFIRLNGFTFAGTELKIELSSKARSSQSPPRGDKPESKTISNAASETIEMLRSVLARRYNVASKFLDLSKLGQDEELNKAGMFDTTSRGSKFFAALMKVCDESFPDPQSKEQGVVSVSLAHNNLTNISSVTTLAQTFPALKNLDLSNNKFINLGALSGWRWKFRNLDHLILSGNPIESQSQSYTDLLKWYPSMTTLDGTQVRSPGEVEATIKSRSPLPILPGYVRDDACIGQDFIKYFFPAYDNDRASLASNSYDAASTFSLSVNNSAHNTPGSTNEPVERWDRYIKNSRNLTKISHLPTKMGRLHTGTDDIRKIFASLPATIHPHLLEEPHKWCMECDIVGGIPDITGQNPGGVMGLKIIVHGEFTEVDTHTRRHHGQSSPKRSFDRTFVIGPGNGFGGVRVVSDMLVLKAYGGHQAWKSEVAHIPKPDTRFALPEVGKSKEQLQKEMLTLEVSRRTGMTVEGSIMCLEQYGWKADEAMDGFNAVKATLPPEIFVSNLSESERNLRQASVEWGTVQTGI